MKEAIEKAIENGYKPIMTWDKRMKFSHIHTDNEGVSYTSTSGKFGGYMGYYELVFGTDFIEHLPRVGICSDGKKSHPTEAPDCLHSKMFGSILCKECSLYNDARYHLKEMSHPEISRDIEKLKEYVGGLL